MDAYARPPLPRGPIVLSVIVGLAAACAAAAGALPEELAPLGQQLDDEAALVDAVRAYDREQTALAEWDKGLAEQHADAGEEDLARDKLEQARDRLKRVRQAYEYILHNYGNNARAHNYYGELLYDYFGEHVGALKAWQLATALDPGLGAPLNNLAIHYCHGGEYATGLHYYDKALELDPDNPDYLFNLAQTYLLNRPAVQRIRQWDKARLYREAMKLSKKAAQAGEDDFELAQDYAVNFYAAENFGVTADWAKAANAWQRARVLARSKTETFYTLLNEGRAWLRKGNRNKAAACLEEAVVLMPSSDVAKQLLIEARQEAPASRSGKR